MDLPPLTSNPDPTFSIIIAVYNDWEALDSCLRSLAEQINAPSLEVIVVDDGSDEVAPEMIRQWSSSYTLTIARQPHAEVSAARNLGVKTSKGAILLFADADSRFRPDCLAALYSTITATPQYNCFQLHLIGDRSQLVGRAEDLRLITFQNHMVQADGCIRYLNTAGFAIRRTRINLNKDLFDPVAVRAEDTFLLAQLIKAGELPFFVPSALVQHFISLSLFQCLLKDIQSARLEAKAYEIIASMGIRIQVTHRERLSILRSMWKTSKDPSIGRSAWFTLVARQGLRLIIFLFTDLSRIRPKIPKPDNHVNGLL